MLPFFDIFGIPVYTFGITLTVCFFSFLWMLKKLSIKFNYNFFIFSRNLIWFSLSAFVFSRLFYIVSKWTDLKYIKSFYEFFISSDYDFSLFGAIFGFFLVLFILLKIKKESFYKYFDGVVLSLIFVLFIGYFGAFFSGQVEGIRTSIGIEVLSIDGTVPTFPLAILYSITFFILFSALYISSIFVNIKNFIGYVGVLMISLIYIMFEFLNGGFDIIKDSYGINFNQLLSIIIFVFILIKLLKDSKFFSKKEKIIIQ